jgi:hypothetical protein
MPQLVPEMILERCKETKHHEAVVRSELSAVNTWPIWLTGCFQLSSLAAAPRNDPV